MGTLSPVTLTGSYGLTYAFQSESVKRCFGDSGNTPHSMWDFLRLSFWAPSPPSVPHCPLGMQLWRYLVAKKGCGIQSFSGTQDVDIWHKATPADPNAQALAHSVSGVRHCFAVKLPDRCSGRWQQIRSLGYTAPQISKTKTIRCKH